MARNKKNKKQEEPVEVKPFEVTGASINDEICNYSYDVNLGPNEGDSHNVKGKNVVHHDLVNAFITLNRHLAAIDDAFQGEDIDIDREQNNPVVGLYHVSGIKIKGKSDNESVILIGTKYVNSVSARVSIETSRIAIDPLASYKWHNELKEAVDTIKREVELYMEGKCTPKEEVEVISGDQLTIHDAMESNEFEEAKL